MAWDALNRLVAPGSEIRLHRQGLMSAMGDPLSSGVDLAWNDRLSRCLDRTVEHKFV